MADLPNLDLDPAQMRAMGELVLTRIVNHLESLPHQPAGGRAANGERYSRTHSPPLPELGSDFKELVEELFEEHIPHSFTTPGPGYLAYIPGGGLYPAALADFIATATNRYTGVRIAAPALAQLEADALDWIRQWMGFPSQARGLFTSGGSAAAFSAVVCAREKLLGNDLRAGVLYSSDQVHHSLERSARLAGIMPDRQRHIPVDQHFHLDLEALREAIAADKAAGLRPFFVASSAGTVNTGAVDDLPGIQQICRDSGLWHHCDGAYGGFFRACKDLRNVLAGIDAVDSLTLDPHKGLFLPYGTGALLVREGRDLMQAHQVDADYLPPPADAGYDAHQYGPELSKPNRGLAVWLSLHFYGAAKLRAALAEKRRLALSAYARLMTHSHLRFYGPPELSLFPFWLTWPGATVQEESEASRELVERVTARGKVMLSGTQLSERYVARICVLCFRTRLDRLVEGVEHIEEETTKIVDARAG